MEPTHMCDYGCGREASHYFSKARRYCCADHYRKCPYQAASIGARRIGKTHSDETKAKIGAKSKQRLKENGGSYFKGRTHTDETKRRISEKNKGKVGWSRGLTASTDERVAKMVEFRRTHPELYSHPGETNGMYGRTHTDEVKQILHDRNIQAGKWCGKDNPWYGMDRSGTLSPRYLPNELRRGWKTYRGQVRYWTEQEYATNSATINPHSLPRGIRQYHIDHIVPLWYGFINDIDPKLLSKKENLRIIWYKDNLVRKKDTLDEIGESTLHILNTLL